MDLKKFQKSTDVELRREESCGMARTVLLRSFSVFVDTHEAVLTQDKEIGTAIQTSPFTYHGNCFYGL